MIKSIFYVLLSLALVSQGMGMMISGLHAAPDGSWSLCQAPGPAVDLMAVSPAGAQAAAPAAQLVGYGTDKDTYSRGDTANGFIMIKNTGNAVINDITIRASVARSVPIVGTVTLGSKDFTLSGLNIGPGETKKATFSVEIPQSYSGLSTAGDYDLKGSVLVGGQSAGDFSKHIKVV